MTYLSTKKDCPNNHCKQQLQYYIKELPVSFSFYQATCPHCNKTFQFPAQWSAVQQAPSHAVEAKALTAG